MDRDFSEHLQAFLEDGIPEPTEAELRAAAELDEALRSMPPVDTEPSVVPLRVTKYSAWVPVSTELLMDAGAIPDTRPRPPWHRRLRWRAGRWRERAARLAYRAVSGEWPYEPDPDE